MKSAAINISLELELRRLTESPLLPKKWPPAIPLPA